MYRFRLAARSVEYDRGYKPEHHEFLLHELPTDLASLLDPDHAPDHTIVANQKAYLCLRWTPCRYLRIESLS